MSIRMFFITATLGLSLLFVGCAAPVSLDNLPQPVTSPQTIEATATPEPVAEDAQEEAAQAGEAQTETDGAELASEMEASETVEAVAEPGGSDSGVLAELSPAQTRMHELLPPNFFAEYGAEAQWDPGLNTYTRTVELMVNGELVAVQQVFVPQMGIEGPEYLDDAEKGWANVGPEGTIQTDDFVPGESGFRYIMAASQENPLIHYFENGSELSHEQRQQIANLTHEALEFPPGTTLIIAATADDYADMNDHYPPPTTYNPELQRAFVMVQNQIGGMKRVGDTLLVFQAINTEQMDRYFADASRIELGKQFFPLGMAYAFQGDAIRSILNQINDRSASKGLQALIPLRDSWASVGQQLNITNSVLKDDAIDRMMARQQN